jgi:NDP-sugar pyrophosphorylase family protein
MQLVVPMSGLGTRFIEKGYATPKPLIPVAGKPMVQHVIEMFPGIEQVLFIVNEEHARNPNFEMIKSLENICPASEIVIIEKHKLGPSWAILQAAKYINPSEPVIVNYCDFSCSWDFQGFRKQLSTGIDGLIATYSGFHPHMLRSTKFAYLKLNQSRNLSEIQEKQSFTNFPMEEPASSGTYGFKSGSLLIEAITTQIRHNDSFNNEFYTSLTYKNMIDRGLIIKSFGIDQFFQWGTPEDLEDFEKQYEFSQFKQIQKQVNPHVERIKMLAAGAGKRFFDAGYTTEKPFLPLADSFLCIEAMNALASPESKKSLLLRKEVQIPAGVADEIDLNDISIERVEKMTEGQAASALVALTGNDEIGSCLIATCDSLVYLDRNEDLNHFSDETMGVWVTTPSEFSLVNPTQFGWIACDASARVTKIWVKESPPIPQDCLLITGTFFFGDMHKARNLISEFLKSADKVNNEFYLDSVLEFALNSNWNVVALKPQEFVSLGTPVEFETYQYWSNVFEKKKCFG